LRDTKALRNSIKHSSTQRVEEVICTFRTTRRAHIYGDDLGVYGYGRNEHAAAAHVHHASTKALFKTDKNFWRHCLCEALLGAPGY